MKCFECDKGTFKKRAVDLTGERYGESFTIHMEALVCSKCGYKTIESSQMGEYALRISDAYRAKHGLLTSDEIKKRRTALGMTQEEFAAFLGVGPASVKRWELGKVQHNAMNRLMVLKTDPQAAHENLLDVFTRLSVPAHIYEEDILATAYSSDYGRAERPRVQYQLTPDPVWEAATC